jgi:hypothetical protein
VGLSAYPLALPFNSSVNRFLWQCGIVGGVVFYVVRVVIKCKFFPEFLVAAEIDFDKQKVVSKH